ncbi:MAG: SGNH/GDSL hydrolase family protein [Clostridiales bacterium]|nr:SGNH/GDSL hydrolase family protein [Clostridiales bacterium]
MNDIFNGKTVLFQGDSVTDVGRREREHGWGYARKVFEVYTSLMPSSTVKFVNRGIGGDRTIHLLNRYEEDFLAVKPDFISILIGINDAWSAIDNAADAVTAKIYENNYRILLEKIRDDLPDVGIIILEPFLLPISGLNPNWRPVLDPRIQIARKLAREFADYYLPLDGILGGYAVSGYPASAISEDGVHPTDLGHGLIAYEWLKATEIL